MRQYNLPKMPLSHVIGSILLLGLTPQLSAKGLDQLKPGSSDNAEEEKSDSNAEQTPTTTQNETIEPQEKRSTLKKRLSQVPYQ